MAWFYDLFMLQSASGVFLAENVRGKLLFEYKPDEPLRLQRNQKTKE